MGTELHAEDHVDHPYARVCDAVLADPRALFQHATAAAASNRNSATLHVPLAGIDVAADIDLTVTDVLQVRHRDRDATQLTLTWKATRSSQLFPTMYATLTMSPLSPTETQLDLDGTYRPPAGRLGESFDLAFGRHIASAAVTSFVASIAAWLRDELAVVVPASSAV